MPLQEHNYWLTTAAFPEIEVRPLPDRVDVAVIGAGFTGLSAARTLAKRGAKVAVLESETIGWGASSRNGGMVLTGMKLGVNQLISMYGRELTRRMYAASIASIDCVEQIVREEAIDCDFSRCGHLEVACKQKHFDDYARQAEVIAREFNHQLRVVRKNELSAEIGSNIYYGGMVDEASAGLNPARYVAGLGRAAMKAGAEIFEHTRVESVQRESSQGESAGSSLPRAAHSGRAKSLSAPAATPAAHSHAAEETHPHRVVHHHNGSPAGNAGARTQPAQPHDLRLEELSLLLPPHARPPHAVRRPRRLLPRNRPHHPPQRRNPAPRHDRRLPATARRQNRIRLGRHARLRLRHHAPRRPDSTACTTP